MMPWFNSSRRSAYKDTDQIVRCCLNPQFLSCGEYQFHMVTRIDQVTTYDVFFRKSDLCSAESTASCYRNPAIQICWFRYQLRITRSRKTVRRKSRHHTPLLPPLTTTPRAT